MRNYLFILFIMLLQVSAPNAAEDSGTLAIIVGLDHPTKSINKPELALIFWRKKLFWPNGERIHPVNLGADNHLRSQFSAHVLASTVESQTDYWNGLYFHGVSPPHVVKSSEAAIRFVAETRGAIAYVPACTIDERVKALAWMDEEGHLLQTPPSCPQ
jgi:ABC-type phosphate transport system substrate-binding protein